jgi:hypothetical protein
MEEKALSETVGCIRKKAFAQAVRHNRLLTTSVN